MFTALISFIAAVSIQIYHFQVPVVAGQDVPVAAVTIPDGENPQFKVKAKGLPCGAVRSSFVRDGYLYVNINPSKARKLTKPFFLNIKAKGYDIVEQGNTAHRLAVRVRSGGDDGVAAYRIPGLVTSQRGTLIATYDIRHNNAYDLQEDIDVGISSSTDGGRTWGPMITAMDMGEYGGLPQKENG